MKNLYILLVALFAFTFTNAQIVDIPDANFKDALVNTNCVDTNNDGQGDSNADINNDGEIQLSEAQSVVYGLFVSNNNISDLEGIQSFSNLKILHCDNNNLTGLDVTQNNFLENLRCDHNFITNLDVSQNLELVSLKCNDNQLASLVVTQNPSIAGIYCNNNQLTNLNVSQNPNLYVLYCENNQLTNLNITQNPILWFVACYDNQLTNIDLTQIPNLERLRCYNNQLTNLDISQNPNFLLLWCDNNQLVNLNLQNGNNTNIASMKAESNPNLSCIQVDDVDYANNQGSWTKDTTAAYSENCPVPIVDIPDANFKYALVNENVVDINGDGIGDMDADTNDDGEIQNSEAEAVLTLRVVNFEIESLEGIQSFTNLLNLNCASNQISSLDVTQNLELYNLNCGNNLLTNIDVTQNQNLYELSCGSNLLTSLDVSQNYDLIILNCHSNQFLNLDVSNNIFLIELGCSNNELTDLDVSQNLDIQYIGCSNTLLTSLDISQNLNLRVLICTNSQITSLDISQNSLIYWIDCRNGQLNDLNINNGNNINLSSFNATENPSLFCIQVDDVDYANNNPNWEKDDWAEYSEECILGLEVNNIISFILYPNPAQDILNVESQQQIENLKIYNLQGQLIKEDSSSRIDVSNLSSGLYFIQVITVEGNSVTKQFIKE